LGIKGIGDIRYREEWKPEDLGMRLGFNKKQQYNNLTVWQFNIFLQP
jgi:hypothetical protein